MRVERQKGRLTEDVGNDGRLVEADGEHLALSVDSDDAARGFVLSRGKDGLA